MNLNYMTLPLLLCILVCTHGLTGNKERIPRYSYEIKPKFYNNSELTESELDNLKSWIDWKNEIPRFSYNLETVGYTKFDPGDSKYKESIGMLGFFYIVGFVLCMFFFVLVISCRVYCNRCGGDSEHIDVDSKGTFAVPFTIIAIGAFIFFAAAGFASYANVYVYMGVSKGTNAFKDEGNALHDNAKNIRSLVQSVNDAETKGPTLLDTKIYINLKDFENVIEQAKGIKDDTNLFAEQAFSFELARFLWLWFHLFIVLVSVGLGLCGFIPCKKSGYLIASTVILFFMFAILFLLLAYTTSEMFLILDICENVYEIVEKNELETKNIGLAHYLRNFVLDNKAYIMTLMYSTSKNYDLLLHDANKKLKDGGLGDIRINNKQDLTETLNETRVIANSDLKSSLTKYELWATKLERSVEYLFDIRYMRHLRKMPQDIEYELCSKGLDNLKNYYISICFMTLGSLIMIFAEMRLKTIATKWVDVHRRLLYDVDNNVEREEVKRGEERVKRQKLRELALARSKEKSARNRQAEQDLQDKLERDEVDIDDIPRPSVRKE